MGERKQRDIHNRQEIDKIQDWIEKHRNNQTIDNVLRECGRSINDHG